MKKRVLGGKLLLFWVVLMMIGCMAVPMEACAASKKLGQVKKVSVKANGCDKVKISWKKVKGAKGYQVYRATSKKGKYTKVKTTKSTKYMDNRLGKGRRYYYKVRAYAGNRKGKYSGIKQTTVKSHRWKKAAAKGHYETKNVQVPFSQAEAPWNQTYNDYVCLCQVCQKKNIRYNSKSDLMEHMNEVNSPGWAEEVYEGRDFCKNCGKDISDEDAALHTIQCGPKGWTNKLALIRTVEHRATAKKVWVKDKNAYRYCTRCGTRK